MGKLQILDEIDLGFRDPPKGQDVLLLTVDLKQFTTYVDPSDEQLDDMDRMIIPMNPDTWEALVKQGNVILEEIRQRLNPEPDKAVINETAPDTE